MRVVPKAVTLRAMLRRSLDAEAAAWMKAHPDTVDRWIADAIYQLYTRNLSDVSGFSVEQLLALQSRAGLAVFHQPTRADAPQEGDTREILRLRRYFFAGHEERGPGGKVVRISHPPALVLSRREQKFVHSLVRENHEVTRVSKWVDQNFKVDGGWTFDAWFDGTAWRRGEPYLQVGHRQIPGDVVQGHYRTEIACNERCVSATGPKCDCACGGQNHGIGAQEVFIPASGAELLNDALRIARDDG